METYAKILEEERGTINLIYLQPASAQNKYALRSMHKIIDNRLAFPYDKSMDRLIIK